MSATRLVLEFPPAGFRGALRYFRAKDVLEGADEDRGVLVLEVHRHDLEHEAGRWLEKARRTWT